MQTEAAPIHERARTDWPQVAESLGPRFAERAPQHDDTDTFVAENYRELRVHRVFSAGVPAELGGGGASHAELCALVQTLARHCGSTALSLAMHTHQVAIAAFRWRHEAGAAEALLRRVAAEELVLVSSGGSDWLAGSGHAERVDARRRLRQRVAGQAAVGIVPGHAGACELARKSDTSALLLRPVHLAKLRHVSRHAAAPLELENDPLAERAGRRVHRLLRGGHAPDHLAVGDDPAHAQAGQECLGKRADRNDLRRRLARRERCDLFAAVPEEAIRVVLDDDRAVARGEIEERVASLIACGTRPPTAGSSTPK